MPVHVVLEPLRGAALDQALDPYGDLAKLWPTGDEAFPLLQYIDPYGNTIFNGIQMGQVLREIEVLIRRADTDAAKALLIRVKELAMRCRDNPHHYLRFVGD